MESLFYRIKEELKKVVREVVKQCPSMRAKACGEFHFDVRECEDYISIKVYSGCLYIADDVDYTLHMEVEAELQKELNRIVVSISVYPNTSVEGIEIMSETLASDIDFSLLRPEAHLIETPLMLICSLRSDEQVEKFLKEFQKIIEYMCEIAENYVIERMIVAKAHRDKYYRAVEKLQRLMSRITGLH